jgi:hypothetical protein
LPGTLKDEVDTKARELIETVLKPKHVQPPPTGHELNYITDITTKWLGSKCYFVSIYACPGPNAISPTFETKFARMEYVGDGKVQGDLQVRDAPQRRCCVVTPLSISAFQSLLEVGCRTLGFGAGNPQSFDCAVKDTVILIIESVG